MVKKAKLDDLLVELVAIRSDLSVVRSELASLRDDLVSCCVELSRSRSLLERLLVCFDPGSLSDWRKSFTRYFTVLL